MRKLMLSAAAVALCAGGPAFAQLDKTETGSVDVYYIEGSSCSVNGVETVEIPAGSLGGEFTASFYVKCNVEFDATLGKKDAVLLQTVAFDSTKFTDSFSIMGVGGQDLSTNLMLADGLFTNQGQTDYKGETFYNGAGVYAAQETTFSVTASTSAPEGKSLVGGSYKGEVSLTVSFDLFDGLAGES